jgi:monofunctional biosynthetic peptidoglycan transglycosylase
MARGSTTAGAPRARGGALRRWLVRLLIIAIVGPPLLVLVYRFVPPPVTILQMQRAGEDGLRKDWRSLDDIDSDLVHAVVAAEDSRFCSHNGFDMEAIRKAMRNNERGGKVRGGSTISQQTAKNVFLWPQRSWVRKGAEAYFTVLTEFIWGKRRMMEVYLNVIEMGPGVYGAEAAAQKWFGKSAANLTRAEAAKLAAILPSPRRYKAAGSGPYVNRRARRIQAAIRVVASGGLSSCAFDGRRRRDDPEIPDRPTKAPPPADLRVLEEAENPEPEIAETAPAPASDPIGDLTVEPAPGDAQPPGGPAPETPPADDPAPAPPPEEPAAPPPSG